MERDVVWLCLKVASNVSTIIERASNKDLSEIQQTIHITRSTVSSFVSKRPSDTAFDICLQSLKATLEQTENCLSRFEKTSDSGLLLEVGKFDFLIKQKADQVYFLFFMNSDEAAANKLTDPRARALWINSFGANARMVPWAEFYHVFTLASGEAALEDDDADILAQCIDFTRDGWVSIYEFEVFLLSFGPLLGSAQRMLLPFKNALLAGYTPSAEANILLHGKDPGSFLIRFSKSNPGAFAVTFVDSKRHIKHCLLYNARPNGVTLKQPPDIFPNLEAFVKAHSARLKIPMGSLAQRFRPSDDGADSESAYSRTLSAEDRRASAYSMDPRDLQEDPVEEKLCIVCMNAPISSCFVPCGHACCCLGCGKKIEGLKEKRCPVCRGDVDVCQKMFLVN